MRTKQTATELYFLQGQPGYKPEVLYSQYSIVLRFRVSECYSSGLIVFSFVYYEFDMGPARVRDARQGSAGVSEGRCARWDEYRSLSRAQQ
eukprot:7788454-Pyramimonas_sp.AAC.1